MKNFRKAAIAGVAAIAMLAAGSVAAPSQAQAGNLVGALIGGAIIGAVVGSVATAHARTYSCWYENQFVGYDQWNRQVFQKVQVCG